MPGRVWNWIRCPRARPDDSALPRLLTDMFRRKSRPRHRRIQESYALREAGKWRAIGEAIEEVAGQGEPLLLVAHFPETFVRFQNHLHTWQRDYELVERPITPRDVFENPAFTGDRRYLALAEMLEPSGTPLPPRERAGGLSVVVAERHPLARHDVRLEQFVAELDLPTRIGYFLALDDPLPRAAVGDMAVTVMRQLGLNEHELIASHLLTRRIDRFTRRLDATVAREHLADSPAEWLERNGSGGPAAS